ncbi:MAG: M55 family metallopeptidase [Synergistaceae bacterium]|jgi:D-amino peptidase|nr:M55 family metallopeptidase [Synergistaceae bacterium]
MKIFISADMEGATGVVQGVQTHHAEKEYVFGCKMQLHDVNAVIEGALDAGTDEILVNDAHARMTNLNIEEMSFDSRVRLLTGSPKPLSMVQGFESSDVAFFVGYHAKAGTPRAVLDHTISGGVVYSIFLNGKEMGETGLNAAVCAQKDIPVGLVTGDLAVCAEAKELMGDALVTACVKTAHTRMSADCLLPEESAKVLKTAAAEAVERTRARKSPCVDIGDGRFELLLTFHNSGQCDQAATIPGTERIDGRTVRVTGSDMVTMRRWTVALISLGGR